MKTVRDLLGPVSEEKEADDLDEEQIKVLARLRAALDLLSVAVDGAGDVGAMGSWVQQVQQAEVKLRNRMQDELERVPKDARMDIAMAARKIYGACSGKFEG